MSTDILEDAINYKLPKYVNWPSAASFYVCPALQPSSARTHAGTGRLSVGAANSLGRSAQRAVAGVATHFFFFFFSRPPVVFSFGSFLFPSPNSCQPA